MSRHRLLSFFLLVIVTCAAAFWRLEVKRSAGQLTAPLVRGSITESVYGIGTVMANLFFQLTPGVTTSLDALYVKEGDFVKNGDKLLEIDRVVYRAPFAGTVTSLPYRAGGNILSNVPVLILMDLENRYVLVSLEQQGALRVKKGQRVHLSFDTIRDSHFDGYVESIYSNNANFLARIEVPSLPSRILPGMTADVAITIRTQDDALLLPVAALQDGKYVWVQQTLPKKVEIKVGIVDRAFAEVISGDLDVGDQALIQKQASP